MKIDIGRRALHVEQAGQGPTILLVHGFPLDHSMWRGQLTGLSDAYRVVAPDLRGFGASDPAPGDATMQALADDLALLLDALAITEPITFCGLSMGGYGTFDALMRRPDYWAAGVPICGGMDNSRAKTIAHIPLWVFHGDKDTAVPVERSRTAVAALKAAGGEPKYTEYAGQGHFVWGLAYEEPELVDWLYAQQRK